MKYTKTTLLALLALLFGTAIPVSSKKHKHNLRDAENVANVQSSKTQNSQDSGNGAEKKQARTSPVVEQPQKEPRPVVVKEEEPGPAVHVDHHHGGETNTNTTKEAKSESEYYPHPYSCSFGEHTVEVYITTDQYG